MDTASLHLLIVNSSGLQDIHLFMYNAIPVIINWTLILVQMVPCFILVYVLSLSLSLICSRAHMDTCRHNHILQTVLLIFILILYAQLCTSSILFIFDFWVSFPSPFFSSSLYPSKEKKIPVLHFAFLMFSPFSNMKAQDHNRRNNAWSSSIL